MTVLHCYIKDAVVVTLFYMAVHCFKYTTVLPISYHYYYYKLNISLLFIACKQLYL